MIPKHILYTCSWTVLYYTFGPTNKVLSKRPCSYVNHELRLWIDPHSNMSYKWTGSDTEKPNRVEFGATCKNRFHRNSRIPNSFSCEIFRNFEVLCGQRLDMICWSTANIILVCWLSCFWDVVRVSKKKIVDIEHKNWIFDQNVISIK